MPLRSTSEGGAYWFDHAEMGKLGSLWSQQQYDVM